MSLKRHHLFLLWSWHFESRLWVNSIGSVYFQPRLISWISLHLSTAYTGEKGFRRFVIHFMMLRDLGVTAQKRAEKSSWRGPEVPQSRWGGTSSFTTEDFLCYSFPPDFCFLTSASDAVLFKLQSQRERKHGLPACVTSSLLQALHHSSHTPGCFIGIASACTRSHDIACASAGVRSHLAWCAAA